MVSTVVASIWASVPFVPTPKRTVDKMIELADLKGGETVYDIGAGDARMLIRVAKKYPGIKAVGYEIVPLVWMLGKLRILFCRSSVRLNFGNSLRADVSDADCVLMYMITGLMPKFAKKFDKELKHGTKVISHGFKFPDRPFLSSAEVHGMLGIN